jgi:hypothetical protein
MALLCVVCAAVVPGINLFLSVDAPGDLDFYYLRYSWNKRAYCFIKAAF